MGLVFSISNCFSKTKKLKKRSIYLFPKIIVKMYYVTFRGCPLIRYSYPGNHTQVPNTKSPPHSIWSHHIIISQNSFISAVIWPCFTYFRISRTQVKWTLSGTQGISAVLREWILRLLVVILGKISLFSCDNRDFIFILLDYRVSKAWATK